MSTEHQVTVTWHGRTGGKPTGSCICGKRCRHVRRKVRAIRVILAATGGLR